MNDHASEHPSENAEVFVEDTASGVEGATHRLLKRLGGAQRLLKGSGVVYIKVNGVDSQPHTYTTPAFVAAVVRAFRDAGATRVVVMENSTQGNYTRVVLSATGMAAAVRAAGGRVLCLDEEPSRPITLEGGPLVRPVARFPRTLRRIIDRRDEVTYVNLPKLKTHSMTDVSLGLKNQWGFPIHDDRIADHNFRLHAKIAAINRVITPDLTIIDGEDAVIHGHFPARTLAHRCVRPLGRLIGGRDVIATDMVGASILGFDPEQVEHIRLAADAAAPPSGGGIRLRLGAIEIRGAPPAPLQGSAELLDEFPPGARIRAGSRRACREGCRGNSLAALQVLGLDHDRDADFHMFFGAGHGPLPPTSDGSRAFLVGDCAIAEVGPALLANGRTTFVSSGCNNLAETIAGLCALFSIPFTSLLPMSVPRTILALSRATLARTSSNLVPLRPVRLSPRRIDQARRRVREIDAVEAQVSRLAEGT